MTFSPVATRISPNGNQFSPRSRGVDHFVVHHAATTSLDGVLGMMSSGSREVSANYVVKDEQIVGVVPEEYRSWSLSSPEWDSRAITVETCNEVAGDASGWPISDASMESLARLIADCANRYGFPIDRDHVLGHREVYQRTGQSYATACPGGIDLDALVGRALAVSRGDDPKTDTPMRLEEDMFLVQVVDWNGMIVLITPNGHLAIREMEDYKALCQCTGLEFRRVSFGELWKAANVINELNKGGVLATQEATRAAMGELLAEAQKRGLAA